MIRIGMSPLVNTHLLGLMLEPFRREHPDIDLILREMNMADLYRMLNEGLLDYVFGVTDTHKEGWTATFLYDEPLLYIPSGAEPRGKQAESLNLRDIADDTYVMVPEACGLSRATRALFQSQRKTLHEYPGQAMSYHVLEHWATLKVGAAILPESKVKHNKDSARTIQGKGAEVVRKRHEPTWTVLSHWHSDHLGSAVRRRYRLGASLPPPRRVEAKTYRWRRIRGRRDSHGNPSRCRMTLSQPKACSS
jgi:DNA-binding transcriptional LysR family regulator